MEGKKQEQKVFSGSQLAVPSAGSNNNKRINNIRSS